MENSKQTPAGLWQEHRINIIISGLILVIGTIVAVTLMQGSLLKTSLVGTAVVDIKMEAGNIASNRVSLVWQDTIANATGSGVFYTDEVGYQARYFTGEVTTLQMQIRWPEFVDITMLPPGIQATGAEKRVIAVGLAPDTTYTFGVLKVNAADNGLHLSNAVVVRTRPGQPMDNTSTAPASGLGDTNGDGNLDSTDPYVTVMYIYYNNWSALFASLQAQGVSMSPTLTETDFKKRSDLDFNCIINFSDVDSIAAVVNGKIALPTPPEKLNCSY